MVEIKKYYLDIIAGEKKGFFARVVRFFLVLLSFVYRLVIALRNLAYNLKIFKTTGVEAKVVSVGNITWSGTGKTTMVSLLYQALKSEARVAAVTKGYARDEYLLLKEKLGDVLDARDRVSLLSQAQSRYQIFILDDGFQYRRLKRDLDLVLLKKEDLESAPFLIPASPFREPLNSLRRAQIAVVTYCPEQEHAAAAEAVKRYNPQIRVFSADYEPKFLKDIRGKSILFSHLQGRPVAVLTAIGYPRGFLNTVAKTGIVPQAVEIYPDHYQFTAKDLAEIESRLNKQGIKDVLITSKDLHHLDLSCAGLNYYILIPEFRIREEERFIREVKQCIGF